LQQDISGPKKRRNSLVGDNLLKTLQYMAKIKYSEPYFSLISPTNNNTVETNSDGIPF